APAATLASSSTSGHARTPPAPTRTSPRTKSLHDERTAHDHDLENHLPEVRHRGGGGAASGGRGRLGRDRAARVRGDGHDYGERHAGRPDLRRDRRREVTALPLNDAAGPA